jgi:hypothetical protein
MNISQIKQLISNNISTLENSLAVSVSTGNIIEYSRIKGELDETKDSLIKLENI